MATFGLDISMLRELLVIGGIVGDWIGGVFGELGPFVSFSWSRFSMSAFCLLFGKHMGISKRG